jgi:hypothetical protein
MFAAHTPMRLTNCAGKQIKNGKERERVLVLSFQLQPFSPEMAGDLNVKGRLFKHDGSPLDDVISTTLAIHVPDQRVEIRMAPDQTRPSVELVAASVKPSIVVRKDREGPVYSATLVVICDYPSGDNLLLLMQRVTEQFFVTLEAEQGSMLADADTLAPRLSDPEDDTTDMLGAPSATH